MFRMAAFVGLLVLGTSGPAFAQQRPPCPGATGVYFYAQNEWKPMEPTHAAGVKISGFVTHSAKATFRDSASPYQVQGPEVAFCLVGGVDSGRDLLLAHLVGKKSSRELTFAKVGVTGVQIEVDGKASVPLTVSRLADKVYLAIARGPVAPGEYLLLPNQSAFASRNTTASLSCDRSGPATPCDVTTTDVGTSLAGYDLGVSGR